MKNFNDILRKLNTYATQELYCWLENIPNACRKIHLRKVDFTIPKDPSESDWGATDGFYNHINYLELKAIFNATQSYD